MPHAASPDSTALPGLLPWQFGVLGWASGILALHSPVPACFCLILIFLFSRVGGSLGPRGRAAVAAVFLAGWGAAAWALPGPVPETPEWMLTRTPATVSGRVQAVETRPGEMLRVFLSGARYELEDGRSGEIPGLLLWNWHAPLTRPHPGQEVRLGAHVKPVRGFLNPGGWDTAWHWRCRGVFFRAWSHGGRGDPTLSGPPPGPLARWREAMRRAVAGEGARFLPTHDGGSADSGEPRGRALLAALILGDRLGLDPELYEAVQEAALGHSLALSGLHLGFAASLGFGLAWLAGRVRPRLYLLCPRLKLGVLLAVPCALFYLWLGGASPSLVRAFVMLASWGLMLWLDRERPLLDGLFLAVALILALSPLSLFDVRLQLSALAVAGICALGPALWRWIARLRLPAEHDFRPGPGRGARPKQGGWWQRPVGTLLRGALGILGVSAAATVALLPLSARLFTQVPLALWTNVLWLPLLGLFAVPVGLAGAVLATLPGLASLGHGLLALDAAVLDWGAGAVEALDAAGWTPALTPMRPLWPHLLGAYALAVGLVLEWRTRQRAAWAGCALALGLLLWPSIQGLTGAGAVRLTLLDVGQGQAVLIEAPGGERTLIDGGGAWSRDFDLGRAVVSPAVAWGRQPRLARVVLTHPDHDHYRGLVHPLGHCRVGRFCHNGRWPAGEEGEELQAVLKEQGIPVEVWRAGQRHELAPGLVLEVLHPADPEAYADNNNGSLVLRLVWQGHALALIPGDAETPALTALTASGADLAAEVLVLPHHGARDALWPELYARTAPRLALASAGFLNHLGFPQPEILAALDACGVPVLGTPDHGQIRLVWDEPGRPARAAWGLE